MAIGNSKSIEERRVLPAGATELSERAFNLIIGGVLLWGFLLNYLMVAFYTPQVYRLISQIGYRGFLLGYFVLCIAGSFMIATPKPVLSFIGYTLIAVPVGMVVCVCLGSYTIATIKSAVLVTAVVTLSLMILGTLFTDFFLSMGRALGVSLLVAIVAELISTFIFHTHPVIYEWIFVAIFSLYIGFDWARANTCARTVDNAVDLAASLYLDIINLLLRILSIMGKRND